MARKNRKNQTAPTGHYCTECGNEMPQTAFEQETGNWPQGPCGHSWEAYAPVFEEVATPPAKQVTVEIAPVVKAEKASKPAKQPREKKAAPPKREAKSVAVAEAEVSGQNVWNAGTHDAFGTIPADFRVRLDGTVYRVDHFADGAWHRYINKAGREGFAATPAATMQWLRRWAYVELGLPRPETPKPVKQEQPTPEPAAA